MTEEEQLHIAMNKAALNLEGAQHVYNEAKKKLIVYLQSKNEEVSKEEE